MHADCHAQLTHTRRAGVPEQAAKQAELAALDLVRLSKPGGRSGQGAGNEGSGLAWSFLSHLGTMLLNKLQMSVRNIHVCFQVGCPSA